MRQSNWCSMLLVIALVALSILAPEGEARGGRGRGGGSFSGIFGGWRKYKKQNNNARRTTNGSPMHTTITKSMSRESSRGASYSSFSNGKQQTKPQASYPKQSMPYGGYGYTNYGSYYGSGGAGAAHLPPGSTYYPNMATMPQGAIYYAQQPQRSGMGDFIFGMMAGNMITNMMHPRPHVTHVYGQYPHQNAQNSPNVIVVENGEASIINNTTSTQSETGVHYWPTDGDVPLAPFNSSVTPADAMQPGKEPIFQRVEFNNFQGTQMTQAASQPHQPHQQQQQAPSTSANPANSPINGIICMPILVNETDPNEPTKILQIERILCFPAPPPPSEALIEPASVNCVTRTFIEADPNDPSQTIEVTKEICTTTTTTLEPPQVAGEIGEVIASEVEKATSAIKKVNEEVTSAAQEEEPATSPIETSTEGKFIRSLTTKSAA